MRLVLPTRLKLLITYWVGKLSGKKIENTDRIRDFLTNKFSYPCFSCTLLARSFSGRYLRGGDEREVSKKLCINAYPLKSATVRDKVGAAFGWLGRR